MEYKEVIETIKRIKLAIKKGNFIVEYDEPNCFEECTAPDGRTFYKGFSMDGPKSSSDFGYCRVIVEGYTFECDLNNGDRESDFFDQIEEEYELKDGSSITKEDLIEDIVEIISYGKGVYFRRLDDMDEIMAVYAKYNNIKNPEYYWCEDEDCPIDINDGDIECNIPSNLDYGMVSYRKRKYYLVEEPTHEEGEQIHAVKCNESPTDQGRYNTVVLTLSYKTKGKIKVIACEECEDQYNIVDGWVE